MRVSKSKRRRGSEGQGALELMMTMGVVFFLLFAVIHVSLICSTKLITNYAAWMAARVWAVNDDDPGGKAKQAGTAILEIFRWGPVSSDFVKPEPENEGVLVEYDTTLGMPFLLTNATGERVTTVGWGAVPPAREYVEEKGDNRER